MPKSVYITAPRPTPEEVAKSLGISKRRQKEMEALAQEIFEQMQRENGMFAGKVVQQRKKRKNASAAA